MVDRLAVVSAPHWLLYKRNFSLEQALRSYYMLWFGVSTTMRRCTGCEWNCTTA